MNDHPDWSPTENTIDLECNPNIQRLTVRAEFNHLQYLKYLLSRLSAPNLQQITIFIAVRPRSREALDWEGWNETDQVLDGVKFRGLREVSIVVNSNRDMVLVREHVFPSMYAKGILNVRKHH